MIESLIIEHYTAERIPNRYPDVPLRWQIYHTVRNVVVRCCRNFGSIGPMQECPINDADEPPADWPSVAEFDFDFFVLDDQLNDEQYIYVEIGRAAVFTADWLKELMHALDDYRGWGVGINSIEGGYILVFAQKLMVTDPMFSACKDLDSVVLTAKAALIV